MMKSLAVFAIAAGVTAFAALPSYAMGGCGGATAHNQSNQEVAQSKQSSQQTAQTPKPETTKQ